MTRAAIAALLAGPTVLAFATGGYPDVPRAWAGLVAWLLAAVGLAVGGLPRGRAAWLAVGGAAAYAAWTLLSVTWAPIAGSAWDAGQIAVLYLGAFVAAVTLLGDAAGRRAVEPALAAGTLVVVGYGLSDRLLPGLLTLQRSVTAEGRLEQPLTYWNAMGVVAAIGLVLVMRLAADTRRPSWMRTIAAAAAAPLGLGLSLTVSRGALFAAVAGVLTLIVATRRREQLQAVLLAIAAGGLASLVAAPFDGVTALADPSAGEGAAVLAGLVVVMALAAWANRRLEPARPMRPLALPRRSGLIALALVAAGFALALVAGTDERADAPLTPGAQRLTTLSSNRYEYWKVAGRAFGDQPLRGIGAGGWAVRWRAERPFAESARDAHSLYFQTAAELGLVGLLALAAWLAGVVLAARTALARAPDAAAGLAAVCAVWAAHVALDWDFQMPAATLPAVVAAGALVALAATAPRRSAAPRA